MEDGGHSKTEYEQISRQTYTQGPLHGSPVARFRCSWTQVCIKIYILDNDYNTDHYQLFQSVLPLIFLLLLLLSVIVILCYLQPWHHHHSQEGEELVQHSSSDGVLDEDKEEESFLFDQIVSS